MAVSKEPLSEDDYPDDSIVSFPPSGLGDHKTAFNYIREEGQDFYRPLNVQIEENAKGGGSGKESKDD